MMTLYRRCPEAYETAEVYQERWLMCPHPKHKAGMVRVVWVCETCNGSGERTIRRNSGAVYQRPCPGCGGTGWQTEEPARVGYGPDAKPEAWVPLGEVE